MFLLLFSCTGEEVEVPSVDLADADNYLFTGGLDIASAEVQQLTDVQFDWSQLSVDLQLHDMDPASDVVMMTLLPFRYLDEAEVMDALSNNALLQSDAAGFFTHEPAAGETSAGVADFLLLGNDIDVENQFMLEEDKIASWLLVLQSTDIPGVGARMLTFLRPSADSEVVGIAIQNTDTVLDFSVTIDGSMAFPAGSSDVEVDWSTLTVDGLGNEFDHGGIDQIMISQYAELSIEALEADFLDLELIADQLYTADLSGVTSVNASALDGFEGIDDEGVWILALRCSTCTHPAPPYLTVLEAD